MITPDIDQWRVTLAGAGPALQIVGPMGERIAHVPTHENHIKHAALLRASPDLLQACEVTLRLLIKYHQTHDTTVSAGELYLDCYDTGLSGPISGVLERAIALAGETP